MSIQGNEVKEQNHNTHINRHIDCCCCYCYCWRGESSSSSRTGNCYRVAVRHSHARKETRKTTPSEKKACNRSTQLMLPLPNTFFLFSTSFLPLPLHCRILLASMYIEMHLYIHQTMLLTAHLLPGSFVSFTIVTCLTFSETFSLLSGFLSLCIYFCILSVSLSPSLSCSLAHACQAQINQWQLES